MIQVLVVLGFLAAAEGGFLGAGVGGTGRFITGGGLGRFVGGGGRGIGGLSGAGLVATGGYFHGGLAGGFAGGVGGGGLARGYYGQQPVYPSVPTPYAFNYVAPAIGGLSARQETGDGSGRVSGSYQLSDADGRQRNVKYTAGPEGFRAHVITNEPGTKSENPADVTVESSAPVAPYYPSRGHYGHGGYAGGGIHKYIVAPSSGPWQ
ncbi:glycine-rich cell wall structural protein 1-like [Limulus polyphemus]|uniref:Glycine-rich cell wall structural protein 1-like n=1 Tax=Limulus polyphemus TaxID=6850 RepID=A0ABM1BB64_LIMPO|nr:glycine-rich cell wall structural protein 1-like [Limulus polyphemus]